MELFDSHCAISSSRYETRVCSVETRMYSSTCSMRSMLNL